MSTPKGCVARRSKDSKNASVTVVEYIPAPAAKTTRHSYRCSACGKPFSSKFVLPETMANTCTECREKEFKAAEKQRRVEEASRIHRTCRDCGKPFYISAAKAEELEAAGMSLFVRCYACGLIKKQEAANASQNI